MDRRQSTMGVQWVRIAAGVGIPVGAVLLALMVGALILFASGSDPIAAYVALMEGAISGSYAFGRTLEKSMPLVFSGLAVASAFKAGLFNIGAQGQLLFGALAAAAAGYSFHGLPAIVHVPLTMASGALAGGLYAAVKGGLKAYTGAHEVITGIMLNYVAINMTDYLASGPMRDLAGGSPIARTPRILESAVIPIVGDIPIGFAVAVVVSLGVWWGMRYTTMGFEIRTVGVSADAARYAGMKIERTIVMTMFVSGLLAGLGGAIETQSIVHRFQPGFNTGLGFDGITIALLARTHLLGVVPAAVLVGAMRAGASQMQFDAGVAPEIIDVIQAFILFFVAAHVIIRWLLRFRDGHETPMALTTGWGKAP